MNWPEAATAVGVSFAFAFLFVGIAWSQRRR